MADTQKFRDRKFCAVLYPEDETHVAAIEKLKPVAITSLPFCMTRMFMKMANTRAKPKSLTGMW